MNIDEKTPLPVSAKFMTSTGKIVEYECDDKLRIDGIAYNIDNEKSKIISHLKTAATTLNLSLGAFSQPAILKLDADGKIKEIDTIMVSENSTLVKDKGTNTNDKDTLVQSTSASTLQYYKNGTFQGKFAIDAKTTIFNIPEEHKDYDAYYVSGKGDLKEDDYTVIAFNATDYLYSDLVIMKEGGSSSYVENIALVKKVLTVYDDTHGDGYAVELMASGKEMTLEVYNNSLPTDLDKGDIVRYSLKRDGNCLQMAKIFDYSAMKGTYVKNLSTSTSAAYTAKHRFSYGRVTSKNNTMFALTYGQKNDAEVFIGDSCNVAIYDPQSKTVEKGSIGDILSAEQNGEGSEVVVFTRHGIVKDVIIYKSMESEVSE